MEITQVFYPQPEEKISQAATIHDLAPLLLQYTTRWALTGSIHPLILFLSSSPPPSSSITVTAYFHLHVLLSKLLAISTWWGKDLCKSMDHLGVGACTVRQRPSKFYGPSPNMKSRISRIALPQPYHLTP